MTWKAIISPEQVTVVVEFGSAEELIGCLDEKWNSLSAFFKRHGLKGPDDQHHVESSVNAVVDAERQPLAPEASEAVLNAPVAGKKRGRRSNAEIAADAAKAAEAAPAPLAIPAAPAPAAPAPVQQVTEVVATGGGAPLPPFLPVALAPPALAPPPPLPATDPAPPVCVIGPKIVDWMKDANTRATDGGKSLVDWLVKAFKDPETGEVPFRADADFANVLMVIGFLPDDKCRVAGVALGITG